MSRFHSTKRSFGYAMNGMKTAFNKEPNLQIHIVIGAAVLIFAAFIGLNVFEWILLLFTIAFVILLELVNTSLEAIVNLVSPEIKPQAKIAKDVAAATVLLAAILSVIIGLVLFLPKLGIV
jgi:diacylglycerol kinase